VRWREFYTCLIGATAALWIGEIYTMGVIGKAPNTTCRYTSLMRHMEDYAVCAMYARGDGIDWTIIMLPVDRKMMGKIIHIFQLRTKGPTRARAVSFEWKRIPYSSLLNTTLSHYGITCSDTPGAMVVMHVKRQGTQGWWVISGGTG
jgi:hypothetical protein